MKKIISLFIIISLVGLSPIGKAENLLQVYQEAKKNNPDLRKSLAERNQAFKKINEFRSPLLPQLDLATNFTYNSSYHNNSDADNNQLGASLKLTQTIFDMPKWQQLNIQEKNADIADITYRSNQQKLILDTAMTYFDVLRALDLLAYIEAQKKAVYYQLDQIIKRFNIGLVVIHDVHNARANYASILAQEISSRNQLENALEKLRQVSGIYYRQLATLNIEHFKIQTPMRVEKILKDAQMYNLSLLSARLSQERARENVRYEQLEYLPTIVLKASTGVINKYSHNNTNNQKLNKNDISYFGENNVKLNLSVPLYTGGRINARIEQAQYGYVSASENFESTYRSVIQIVRSSYNNVMSSISRIKAYQQIVISAQSLLDAMKTGYQVGTRTIMDVLNATATLFQAKQNLANAHYDYLINNLKIQYASGTLNESDLSRLNNSLGKILSTSPKTVSSPIDIP